MTGPSPAALRIGEAIRQQFPALRPVALPRAPLFGAPPHDPESYPDARPDRGYYLPVPPPAGRHVQGSPFFRLVGVLAGRPVRVEVLAIDSITAIAPPSIELATWTRLLRPEVPPATALPWYSWVLDPGPAPRVVLSGRGRINLTARFARTVIGRSGILMGRPLAPTSTPPVRAPVFLAAGHPGVAALLASPESTGQMAAWERRAGKGFGSSGPTLPAVGVIANRARFESGIDPALPPEEHARTVREVLELFVRAEQVSTGLDPEATPLPMTVFHDPPESVPDARPVYPCPKCGRPELVKAFERRVPRAATWITAGCGVDYFPPLPVPPRGTLSAYEVSEAMVRGPG